MAFHWHGCNRTLLSTKKWSKMRRMKKGEKAGRCVAGGKLHRPYTVLYFGAFLVIEDDHLYDVM